MLFALCPEDDLNFPDPTLNMLSPLMIQVGMSGGTYLTNSIVLGIREYLIGDILRETRGWYTLGRT
jgi:hypothetical protein